MELLKEQEIDLRDYLRILVKRKWIIITCFSIAALIGSIRAFTAIPVYLAKAQMVIERENPNLMSIQEVMSVDSAGSDYYQTQYKIITSRAVAREVITRMGLENSPEFFPKPKNDILTKLRRQIILTLSSWKKKVLSLLNAGEPAGHKLPRRKKAMPSGVPGDTNSASPTSGLVSALVSRIQVEPIPNSRLVNVGVFAKDRVLAANMANQVVQAYIDQNLETKLSAAKDAVKWLGDRIEEEREKVEEAESALLNYKEAHQIITDFSSDSENITAEKLAQLNSQVVDAESRRVEAETRYRQALAVENSPEMLDSIPEVLSNSLIQEIKRMEVGLYNRVSELSKKYGPKHPQMVAIYSELEALKERKIKEARRVVVSLRSEYKLALARESALKKALAKQKGESLSMNKKAIQYGVLRRQAESSKHMYELLFKRFKETSLTEEMKTGNIRVIDKAEIPTVPISPNKRRMVLLSMILGIALGIGFAFALEYLDNTIRFPEEIRDYLGIPYMGPVPAFDTDEVLDGMPVELITLHSPKAAASESFRGIRTSILFSSAKPVSQVILVTSAMPSEGKTLCSANLAVAMAQAGSRVLLLDCDMRRPTIHKTFRIGRHVGLSSVMYGRSKLEDAIIPTKIPNLDVIPCGPIPPNPSEMLGSKKMRSLIDELRRKYTKIIIDSSPISAVTDSIVLTQISDGIVLVIRASNTPRQLVKNTVDQLKNINAYILGSVLNAVKPQGNSYYHYQYNYQYGHAGNNGHKKKKRKFRG